MSIGKSFPYQSPISKLLRFFCRSRDKWKAKCKAAKQENKSLKYCLAKMTESRNRWKADARNVEKSSVVETASVEMQSPKKQAGLPCRRGRRKWPA